MSLRNLLIVSPYFPPLNTPDLHRVRLSLSHFREFGWDPRVLAIDPTGVPWVSDPSLVQTFPSDVPIHRVSKLPAWSTSWLGLRNAGLRALPYLYAAGRRILRRHAVDLVYFSTTVFPTMALGRLWKAEFGTPFVVDLQDPWVGDYYEGKQPSLRPKKDWASRPIHRALEPWTMRSVDGIIAVSAAYHETMRRRYPWIREERCRTIPFGASEGDFEIAMAAADGRARDRSDRLLHGVAAGVLGKTRRNVCALLCEALRAGLERSPEIFERVRLRFIGTDYAAGGEARKTIEPLAREMGLGEYVEESTERLAYFSVLRLLREADFLLIPGSDNPDYTASRLYPYILAKRPLFAVVHEESSMVGVLDATRAGSAFTFRDLSKPIELAAACAEVWGNLLRRIPFVPDTDWSLVAPFEARALTRAQCELFSQIVEEHATRG